MRLRCVILCVLLLPLAGCGYSWVRYGGGLGDARSVAIQTFENGSYEPGVESLVTDALRREVVRRGGARLIEDPERADLVLSGAVATVSTGSRSFSSVVLALEYVVTMRLQLSVKRIGVEQPIYVDPRALRESESYLASADVEAQRKNRREALVRLSNILAARIYDTLYETQKP